MPWKRVYPIERSAPCPTCGTINTITAKYRYDMRRHLYCGADCRSKHTLKVKKKEAKSIRELFPVQKKRVIEKRKSIDEIKQPTSYEENLWRAR